MSFLRLSTGVLAALLACGPLSWAGPLPSLRDIQESLREVEAPSVEAVPVLGEDFEFDFDGQVRYYEALGQPLDWAAVAGGEARVIYLGEPHFVKAVKAELAQHMAELRGAGITHLALEMFGSDHQEALDRFFFRGTAEDSAALARILQKEWGWIPGHYVGMLEAARRAGIRPLAIDMPDSEEKAILEKRRAEGKSVGPAALFVPRDEAMVRTLGEFLARKKDARIFVLAGIDHLEVSNQPDLLESTYGVSTRRYTLLWGGGDPLDVGIEKAKLSWKRLFIPFPRTLRRLDGIIAVPEIRLEGNGTGMLPGSPD